MIQWGIIGLGNIAMRFYQSISHSQNGKVYAVASHSQNKIDKYYQMNNQLVIYQDYHELIQDKNIDAIYIALPHGMHYQWAKEALIQHKHVFVEKPSTLSFQETEELCQLSKKYQVVFMEALKTRFIAFNQVIKDDIASGIIGNIHKVQASFCNDVTHLARKPGWYLFDSKQGGALLDVGPYPLSFIMDHLGSDYTSITSSSRHLDAVDSYFYSEITYPHGAIGVVEGAIDENKDRIGYIYGDLGTMEIPMYNRPLEYTIHFHDGSTLHKSQDLQYDDMFDEIEMVHYLINHQQSESSLWSHQDSIALMKMIEDIKKQL